jgi:hypothetical protein
MGDRSAQSFTSGSALGEVAYLKRLQFLVTARGQGSIASI